MPDYTDICQPVATSHTQSQTLSSTHTQSQAAHRHSQQPTAAYVHYSNRSSTPQHTTTHGHCNNASNTKGLTKQPPVVTFTTKYSCVQSSRCYLPFTGVWLQALFPYIFTFVVCTVYGCCPFSQDSKLCRCGLIALEPEIELSYHC